MKQYNCHEGALPFTKSYLLRPLFNAFLMAPKPFHATEACIGCKKCEKVCPVGNITVTDRPVWGGNCTQCLACYHVCPVHAVEYGKMTGMIQAGLHKFFLLPLPGKVGNVLPAIRLLCRIRMFLCPVLM